MLSLEESQKILNSGGKNYTIEQVEKIRDFLYTLAKIDIELFKKRKSNEKSNLVHKSKHNGTERAGV